MIPKNEFLRRGFGSLSPVAGRRSRRCPTTRRGRQAPPVHVRLGIPLLAGPLLPSRIVLVSCVLGLVVVDVEVYCVNAPVLTVEDVHVNPVNVMSGLHPYIQLSVVRDAVKGLDEFCFGHVSAY